MSFEKGISVSDIALCSLCPMKAYLQKSDKEYVEPASYTVAKQISYHLGEELVFDDIFDELELVLSGCGDEEREILNRMITACDKTEFNRATGFDLAVKSEKYNIFGRVDRVFGDGFSVVKPGTAPTNGVYASDRIRCTGYLICLTEMFKKDFNVYVEYLGSGTVRKVEVSAFDRRAFLTALRQAEKIQSGEIPKTVFGKMCLSCKYKDSCEGVRRPKTLFERLRS